MAYKKLSEATLVESVSDVAKVLIEENDEIKRVPKNMIGGGFVELPYFNILKFNDDGFSINGQFYELPVDQGTVEYNNAGDLLDLFTHELLGNAVYYSDDDTFRAKITSYSIEPSSVRIMWAEGNAIRDMRIWRTVAD